MRIILKGLAVLVVLLVVAGLAIFRGGWGGASASHPSLTSQTLPPLIPVGDFFANTDSNWDYRPSPQGKWISWKSVEWLATVIKVKPLNADGPVYTFLPEQGFRYSWDFDGEHLLIQQSQHGRDSLWKARVDAPEAEWEEITPRGFNNWHVFHRALKKGDRWLVSSRDRNAKLVDIYSIEPGGLGKQLEFKNPGDVVNIMADSDGNVALRFVTVEPGIFRLERRPADGPDKWNEVLTFPLIDHLYVATRAKDGTVQVLTRRNRDKVALVQLDLATGAETPIAEDEDRSINRAFMLKRNGTEVDFIEYASKHREYVPITERGKKLLGALKGLKKPHQLGILGHSLDGNLVTVAISEQEDSWRYVLVDLEKGSVTSLGDAAFAEHKSILAETKPIVVKSRDGNPVPSLLTIPKGLEAKKLPMVVLVHGGPAARHAWGYHQETQFLANRGYAVLSVNYRGSTGFGKKFQESGYRQYGRGMQDDIVDATRWAIEQGIADPKKIAIYGASFGGYSAMMGVARDPKLYAAGISVVGATDIEYQSVHAPHFWGVDITGWTRYFGDPESAEDRKEMKQNSPISHVEKIEVPVFLAHGILDRVVDRAQSEQFERALKTHGKKFEAHYYEKEGHGFRRWQTKVLFHRQLEDFLAKHLGGRSGGFHYSEIGAKYLN